MTTQNASTGKQSQSTQQSNAQPTMTMQNAQLIQNTQQYKTVVEYIAAVRNNKQDQLVSAAEWDKITNWRDLCVTLGIDFNKEANGKARPAIDKVAARLHGTQPKESKPSNTSVSVVKPATTSTHTAAVSEQTVRAPRRVDFSEDDLFEEAYDQWYREHKLNAPKQEAVKAESAEQPKAEKAATEKAKKVAKVAKTEEPKPVAPAPTVEEKPEPAPAPVVETKPAVSQTVIGSDVEQAAKAFAELLHGFKPRAHVNTDELLAQLEEKINNLRADVVAELKGEVNQISDEVEQNLLAAVERMVDAKAKAVTGTIEIKVNGLKTGEVKGHKHEKFEQILRGASIRRNIMLVGPAGAGKSTVCEQVAEALGLKFYGVSVCSQTPKSDLLGYMSANGGYVGTDFRQAFEHGGVFVLDEIDNGNPNVLSVLNSALANKWCSFADGMVAKHENFILIATANTYGTGANATYVGRNPIDGATLDRFAIIPFGYDEVLELNLSANKNWCKTVQAIRKTVANERVIVSPRASIDGSLWLAAGEPMLNVLDLLICKGMPENLRQLVIQTAQRTYKK